jgi:hypothetical protein
MPLAQVPGFQSLSIRNPINRIRVGITTNAAAARIRQIISATSIPSDAGLIEVEDRVTNAADTTLHDSLHVRVGALRIQVRDLLNGYIRGCTLGANANTGTSFFTASHCTARRGPDPINWPSVAYQPWVNTPFAGAVLGSESFDPPLFHAEEWNCCMTNQDHCTYTDVAMFSYNSGVAPGQAGDGLIAKTTYSANGTSVKGSDTLAGRFQIAGDWSPPEYGAVVQKIGATTGWTYGTVYDVCADMYIDPPYYDLCQVRASGGFVDSGDSGAPVFHLNAQGQVYFAGMIKGGGPYQFVISRIDYMRQNFPEFTLHP